MLHDTRGRYSTPQGAKAFTIIELMIVIGIIAILIGLLFPAINQARRSAYRATCASQLRQIGIAIFAYAGDHDDRLPYAYTGSTVPNIQVPWDDRLGGGGYDERALTPAQMDAPGLPLTKKSSVYLCPADKARNLSASNWLRRSYTMPRSVNAGSGITPMPRPNPGWWGIGGYDSISVPGTAIGWSMRLGQVEQASAVFLLTERPYPLYNALGNGSCSVIDNPAQQLPPGTSTLHGTFMNYLYCDGHVVGMRPQDTVAPGGTLTMPKGSWTRNNQQ